MARTPRAGMAAARIDSSPLRLGNASIKARAQRACRAGLQVASASSSSWTQKAKGTHTAQTALAHPSWTLPRRS